MFGWRTILMIWSSRFCPCISMGTKPPDGDGWAHLEPLVLQNPLDGRILIGRRQLGLEDNAERTVANNLALGILQLPGLAGDTVLNLLTDGLWNNRVLALQNDNPSCSLRPRTSHPQGIERGWAILRHRGIGGVVSVEGVWLRARVSREVSK